MHIGWIGGIERNEAQLAAQAAAAGHELEFHPGHLGGRGSAELRRLVERSDLVIILTQVNSHGAVQLAKRWARHRGRSHVVLRRCNGRAFERLLEALDVRGLTLGDAHAALRRAG
jgi:hypothetical protein